jgi:hypothetical protein
MTWLYNTPTKIILIISFLLTSCEKEDLILSKIDSKINPTTTNEKIKSSNIKRSRNRKSRKRKTIIR